MKNIYFDVWMQCGALSIISKDGTVSEYDGELTIIGLLASSLSCDPRQARLICFSYLFGFLKEGVVMGMRCDIT